MVLQYRKKFITVRAVQEGEKQLHIDAEIPVTGGMQIGESYLWRDSGNSCSSKSPGRPRLLAVWSWADLGISPSLGFRIFK